jgi:uncharacterized protein YdeI (YjbR/CyaY-like superfamily)
MKSSQKNEQTFTATLEHMPGNLGWVIVRIPFNATDIWGKRGQIRVKGDINGFEFRTSLFPDGKGNHFLMVNKKMQKGGKVLPGIRARFRLEPDTSERAVRLSPELAHALRSSKRLQKFYDGLSYSMKHWIANWVAEPKSPEAHTRRAEQVAVQLMETMEAERELPPMITRAMAERPQAAAGWKKMTATQRRAELLAIFYYRRPDSRQRRIVKAVATMMQHAAKRQTAADREE